MNSFVICYNIFYLITTVFSYHKWEIINKIFRILSLVLVIENWFVFKFFINLFKWVGLFKTRHDLTLNTYGHVMIFLIYLDQFDPKAYNYVNLRLGTTPRLNELHRSQHNSLMSLGHEVKEKWGCDKWD